jgi:hypothetical protein
MTYYINTETQEIFSERRKNLQENTENFKVLYPRPKPVNIAIDEYIEYGVKEEEGIWTEDWQVLKLDTQRLEEKRTRMQNKRLGAIRPIRNSLLTQLDYKQLTMISQGTSTVELENDKDSLRDLPSNIVWPSDLNEISNYEPPLLNQIRTKYSIA